MQAHTNYTRYFQTGIYADLHWFLGFIRLIRVHLWNPWLMTCSTIIEDPLQIGPFFAKQSQFPQRPNERKTNKDKGL